MHTPAIFMHLGQFCNGNGVLGQHEISYFKMLFSLSIFRNADSASLSFSAWNVKYDARSIMNSEKRERKMLERMKQQRH